MSPDVRDSESPAPSAPRLRRIRTLWRLQGPSRVVAATLYRHPAGVELVLYFEPEAAGDVLETRATRRDVRPLEQRAEEVRRVLLDKGWCELLTQATEARRHGGSN